MANLATYNALKWQAKQGKYETERIRRVTKLIDKINNEIKETMK